MIKATHPQINTATTTTADKSSISSFASNILATLTDGQPKDSAVALDSPTTTKDSEYLAFFLNGNAASSKPSTAALATADGGAGSSVLAASSGSFSVKSKYLGQTAQEQQWLVDLFQHSLSTHSEFIHVITAASDSDAFTDGELTVALRTLDAVAAKFNCKVMLLYKTADSQQIYCLVRKVATTEEMIEVRIASVGNVDAGKSTLLGVLVSNDLDDGRGHARINLFKHKHEVDSGRTSSVGVEIMGFTADGAQVVKSEGGRKLSWEDIVHTSSKVLTFLDLAGHEKYLKTTIFGLTGCAPDYIMLIIGSNAGMIGMAKEHLGLALALNVPVFVVVTKIDMCPANILDATLRQMTKILKSPGCRKIPLFMKDMESVVQTAQTFVTQRVCPVFQISSVSGDGMDRLRMFLNLLSSYRTYDSSNVEFQITDTFSVPGVGTVVSGTVLGGSITAGETLLLGPDANGAFLPCVLKSIHRKRIQVSSAQSGNSITIALKKIKRSMIRKGMVLVGKDSNPKVYFEFEAEILILYHSSTIGNRYQAMVHVGNVRQAARIVEITHVAEAAAVASNAAAQAEAKDNAEVASVIRTGDRAHVRFRFLQTAEYIKVGQRLLIREGRTKMVGKIISLHETTA